MRAIELFVVFLGRILNFAILLRLIISWLPIDPHSQFVRVLHEITEPILGPLRRVIPSIGGLDLSPMVGLILIQIAQTMLLTLLRGL